MWLWASLIVGWLALLAVGIWVTAVAGGGWSGGVRARLLAYAPALGMQVSSIAFGVWALLPGVSQDDWSLMWVAIGCGAVGLVLGIWYSAFPWWEDAEGYGP